MVSIVATPHVESASVTLAVVTDGTAPSFVRDYRGAGGAVSPAQVAEWDAVGGATIGNGWPNSVQITAGPDEGGRLQLTGLDVGETYRVRILARRRASVLTVKAGVGTLTSWTPPLTTEDDVPFEFTFVAAAATANVDVLVATASGTAQRWFTVRQVIVWPDGETLAEWDLVALTRTDANGTRDVRLPDGASLSSGTLGVNDSEGALVGPIEYRVTVRDALTTSTEQASTTTTLDGVDRPQLAPVALPQLGRALRLVLADGWGEQRASSSTVHDVIGRAAPLVTIGPLRTRAGQYRVWCEDYATAQAVVALAARGDVLQVRHPRLPGADMYHLATSTSIDFLTVAAIPGGHTSRWAVTVGYVEVDPPSGPLLGAVGWTFDALASTYGSFAEVAAAYATFTDLLIGPTS
ncbi:hypothetical protein [Cellulosimicrobium sp. 22601]|uniref:hypothetical protein n=1 Tax=unclassified Cellulosimicrobium TaxID=2624466 RepID=UPI003F83573F